MEELPPLPPQFKTWKEFWLALSPAAKEGKINTIRMISTKDFHTVEEYHVKQIKEGVFREAVAGLGSDDLTLEELHLVRYELIDLNVHGERESIRAAALRKIEQKIINYPHK